MPASPSQSASDLAIEAFVGAALAALAFLPASKPPRKGRQMACNCGGSARIRERRQQQIAAREARKEARDAKRAAEGTSSKREKS